jgi:type IV fimbrial biogenesis protein FimT
MNRMHGISLIEVVLALAVLAVLAGIALPAFADVRLRAQFASAELALGETVLLANRLAVSGGSAVVLCPARTSGECEAGSDGSGGWLSFVDLDGDRRFGPHDVLAQRHDGYSADIALVSNMGRQRVVFHSRGDNAGSNLSFVVCSRTRPQGRRLALSNGGRLRSAAVAPEHIEACRSGRAL